MAEVLLRGAVSSLAGGWAVVTAGPGPALPDVNLVGNCFCSYQGTVLVLPDLSKALPEFVPAIMHYGLW